MYKRESGGWLKHCDFLLLDMICLQIAFLLSFVVLGRGFNPYSHILYRKMALYLELADVVVVFFFDSFSGVLKKGYYRNFVSTVQHAAIVFALSVLYLFLSKEGQLYSRLSLVITFILYIFITYAVRELRKREIRKQMENGSKESLFIVTTGDVAGQVVDKMMKNNYARYRMAGMAVIDTEAVGQTINGVDVVADALTAVDY
ncbi:MAG: sugar transferase, partial [Coprococcus catus]|nr:sugar transferase [Coprococcus catus]